MRARAAPDRPSTLTPSMAYVPEVGESRQPMIAMSVDFPEPEGPTRATNSPRWTVRSIPRSACTAMPFAPKTFVRPRVSIIDDIDLTRVSSYMRRLLMQPPIDEDLRVGWPESRVFGRCAAREART
jgi:hypothetical protein